MRASGIRLAICGWLVAAAWQGRAGTYTWDAGGGGDTNWSTGANWTNAALDNTVPTAEDDAVFALTGTRTVGIGDTGDQSISNVTVTGSGAWIWQTNASLHTLDFSGQFIYGGSGSSSFRAPLTGIGSLLVSNGVFSLTSSNDYSGGTTLTGGQIRVAHGWAVGSGALTLANGVFGPVGEITNYNPLVLAGNTIFGYDGMGGRTLRFMGDAALTGNRTFSAFTDASPDYVNVRFEGVIDDGVGSYGITYGGAATIVLTGVNTFKGGLTVTGGSVDIQNDFACGTGPVTLGTVPFSSSNADRSLTNSLVLDGNVTFGWGGSGNPRNLRFTGPVLLTGTRILTCIVNSAPTSVHAFFEGPVSDSGAGHRIIKAGGARLGLSGSNQFDGVTVREGILIIAGESTFPGGTRLEGGTLVVSNNNVLGTSDLTFVGGAAHVWVNDYTITNRVLAPYPHLIQTSSSGAANRTLTLAGPVVLSGDTRLYAYYYSSDGRNLTLSGSISDGVESYSVRKTGYSGYGLITLSGDNFFDGGIVQDTGTLLLTGDNTGVTGGIIVNAGTVQGVARAAGTGNPFGANRITLNETSASLQLDGAVGAADMVLGDIVYVASAPTLYVNGSAEATTWTASRLVRDGRAVLVFRGSGSSPNPLTANDRFKTADAPGVTNGMVSPHFLETTGDFLTYDGAGRGFQRVAAYAGGDINAAAADSIYSAPAAQTLTANRTVYALKTGQNIDGSYDLSIGSGGVIITASRQLACNLDFGEREGIVWVSSGTATNAGMLKGANGLTKVGPGTMYLAVTNAYTGSTAILAGQITLGATNALPTNQTLFVTGGTLDLNGQDQVVAELILGRGEIANRMVNVPSVLHVGGRVAYNGQAAIRVNNNKCGALIYSRPTGSGTNGYFMTVNLTGPTVFDIADGPHTPDLALGGSWYDGMNAICNTAVSGSGNTPITKKGGGFLQFRNDVKNTFVGDITIEDGVFHGLVVNADGGPFGDPGNNVNLLRNGVLSFGGGGTGYSNTLANVAFAGGNKMRCNLGADLNINLASLTRTGGSRGTLVLAGANTGTGDHFDSRGRVYVAGWIGADPDENDMTPPVILLSGARSANTEMGQADFCKVNPTTGRINRFTSGDPGYTTSFPASTVGTEKIYLGAAAVLSADKSIWALQTTYGVTQTGDTTITLGSGGLILNSDIGIESRIRFGATGTREAFVYVAGADHPYMRTATLSGQLVTSGGLTKFGEGILVLTADSSGTLSGDHWINQGTLRLGHANAVVASAALNIERGATLEIGGSYTLNNAIAGLGSIGTGANLLTLDASSSLTPGFAGECGALAVEDLDFRGTLNWEYDGTTNDVVACTTLAFGGGAVALNVQWIGSGAAAAARGAYTLFTYQGADPVLPDWMVTMSPVTEAGAVTLDSANKRVLLTISKRPNRSVFRMR